MYVFVVGLERCGTHSVVNIVRSACRVSHHVVHEEPPTLCQEAKLLFEGGDFRTPRLEQKLNHLKQKHDECLLVLEANHRLGYFTTLLMKEFAPECKFIFLVRNPLDTILSRLGVWAHYPAFLHKYPESYIESMNIPVNKQEFNTHRISPPLHFSHKSVVELYLWEWLENYKFVRAELTCIPKENRLLLPVELLTKEYERVLDFISKDYFRVDDEVVGWSRVKSDSIYVQSKEFESDRFETHGRRLETDTALIFARQEVDRNARLIASTITKELSQLPELDSELVELDMQVVRYFNVKMV